MMMNAVQQTGFGGGEVMKYTQVEKPKVIPGGMMVKVKAFGINPVEIYKRNGGMNYANLKFPFIPGGDFAGIVEETSEETQAEFPIGTKVWVCKTKNPTGAYAEYATCNPSEDIVGKMPEEMPFEQGAAMGVPYMSAAISIKNRANVQPGQTVAIHGASGGVGMAACNYAAAMGCTVFATVGTEEGATNAKAAGATHVFFHNKEGYVEEMMKAAEQFNGIDAVIDNAAHVSLSKSMTMVKTNGHVIIVGARGPHDANIRLILQKQLNVRGFFLFLTERSVMEEFRDELMEMTKKGQINATFVKFAMEDIAAAQNEVMNPSSGGARGKVVIMVN